MSKGNRTRIAIDPLKSLSNKHELLNNAINSLEDLSEGAEEFYTHQVKNALSELKNHSNELPIDPLID